MRASTGAPAFTISSTLRGRPSIATRSSSDPAAAMSARSPSPATNASVTEAVRLWTATR